MTRALQSLTDERLAEICEATMDTQWAAVEWVGPLVADLIAIVRSHGSQGPPYRSAA
jgi:hypothetical protein